MTAFQRYTADDDRKFRTRVQRAARTGKRCARCGERLKAGEPIWRERIQVVIGRVDRIAPVCEQCAITGLAYPVGACVGCGRQVHEGLGVLRHPFTFCSEVCAVVRRRTVQQPKACTVCGGVFQPQRSTAKTCSAACKQRAYRQRVAAHA